MRVRAGPAVVTVVFALAAACVFRPDYGDYARCDEGQACPSGQRCFEEEGVCLPECGEQPASACLPAEDGGADAGPDGGDSGFDAGEVEDAGADAGDAPDGGEDAGLVQLTNVDAPPAVELEAYAHSFGATGGTPPYLFEVSGTVPPGLLFDAGTLWGTPAQAGLFTFAVQVTDDAGASDSAPVSLEVARRLRLASGGPDDGGVQPISDADVGVPYSETLHTTGGSDGGRTFALLDGGLPSGLVLTATGEVTGTPGGSGTHLFVVQVRDDGPPAQVRARALSITLQNAGVTLHMRTRSLPLGRVGEPYVYELGSGGGTGTHTWMKTGSLPPGINLVQNRLEGTPTTAGDYTFTLAVTDTTVGYDSRTFTLRVD